MWRRLHWVEWGCVGCRGGGVWDCMGVYGVVWPVGGCMGFFGVVWMCCRGLYLGVWGCVGCRGMCGTVCGCRVMYGVV